MQILYDIQANHLIKVMEALTQVVQSPTPVLFSIGESLLNANQDRHSRGLNPDGTPWTPLKPSTLLAKRTSRLLYESGDLLRFQYQVQGKHVVIGTNDWKAVFHHFGTKPYVITPRKAKALAFGGHVYKRVNHPGLPMRQLVGFPTSDRKIVEDTTMDYITHVLNSNR